MPDPLSEEVSHLLRCPVTRQTLHRASSEELDGFDHPFPEGAFLTEDGERAYPIESGFPILVPSEAVERPGAEA